MDQSLFIGLINNAALLMALGLVYDMLPERKSGGQPRTQQILLGLMLGVIGCAVMLTPWQLTPGVVVDTRSVLLSVTGLFFGTLPTLITLLMTALLRLWQGGAGAWTGVSVICASGLIGLVWRLRRQGKIRSISAAELYLIGLITHAVMLLLMLTLPGSLASQVLPEIGLPVMAIFPLATVLLGLLLKRRVERRLAGEALRQSEERYRTTLLSIGDGVVVVDANGQVEFMNPVAETLTGWQQAEAHGTPLLTVFQIINEKTRRPVDNPVDGVLRYGKPVGLANHTLLVSRDGTERPIADCGSPILNASGEITGVVLVFRDQSREREMVEALRQSEARLQQAQRVAHVGSWAWHIQTDRLEWSDEMYRIFGIEKESFSGSLAEVLDRSIHPADRPAVEASNASVLGDKRPIPLEYRIIRPDGTIRTVWAEAGELIEDEAGRPLLLTGIVMDITERKLAENELKATLGEKEVLLRELYHRTKNNMQVIRSMLVLQTTGTTCEEVRSLVQETERKLQAMALAHQMLFQSQSLSRIALQTYIQKLAELTRASYPDKAGRVSLRFDLEPVVVTIDVATPLGLILNELLSNAFKHAFPEERSGEVFISLCREDQGRLRLQFADDGVGVPPGFDLRGQTSYGLMSIFSLAEDQLDGRVQVETGQGLGYTIVFSDDLYQTRV